LPLQAAQKELILERPTRALSLQIKVRRNRGFSEVAGIPAEVWRGYRLCHSALLFLDRPSQTHLRLAAFLKLLQQFSELRLMLEEVWMVEIELFHGRRRVPSRTLPRIATCTVPS
jgi:hypothetical protein